MKALLKLTPICVIAGLMLSGMDILLAAPLSFMYSVIIAMIVDRYKFQDCLDAALDNLKHFLIVFLILQAAYAVAECFMATGVAAAVINMSLAAGLNAKVLAVVALLVTSVQESPPSGSLVAALPRNFGRRLLLYRRSPRTAQHQRTGRRRHRADPQGGMGRARRRAPLGRHAA